MKWLLLVASIVALCAWQVPTDAHAEGCVVDTLTTADEGDPVRNDTCDTDKSKRVSLTKCLAGESFCVGTSPDSYIMVRTDLLSSGKKTADAQIKASAGYAGNMICIGDSSAAAGGTIIVYDSLTETGTALFTLDIVASADYHIPMVIPIYTSAATGIYLGYTTVSDVACTVFYR